jgi:hypothetical protein
MLINEIPYDKDKSDSIVNHIPLNVSKGQFFEAWYMREYHMVKYYGLSSKQIFKKVFGRQLTCVYTAWNRRWVWTFSNDDHSACIYCMVDISGVRWEMNIDSDLSEIIKLRDEIEKRLIA